jgi:hypothetical protein
MTLAGTGRVVITDPTRGLGRDPTLEMARRAEPDRPDLPLVGRRGETLMEVAVTARAPGRPSTRSPTTCPDWPTFGQRRPRRRTFSPPARCGP